MLNEDYREMLQCLGAENVDSLLVGAYALAAHGYPRATMDIDIGVMPAPMNAQAMLRALAAFGTPLHDLTESDLQKDDTIFQICAAPRRIDIITGALGLRFQEAFNRSIQITIEGQVLRVLCIDDLIVNQRASGRTKDLADAEALQAWKDSEQETE